MRICRIGSNFKRRSFLRSGAFALVIALIAGTSGCVIGGASAQRNFRPVHAPLPRDTAEKLQAVTGYHRPESATYLTFPEWYLVFNPQEYATYIQKKSPSGFPYFRSIEQFWSSYAQVSAIANGHYSFDYGSHLMVSVIGVSSTAEYVIKGVYENTIGRLSEASASGARTPEDDYAARVAREYGNFIPTRPWFEFPYGHKLGELWTETRFFGPHFVRKFERKLFLSSEYGLKSLYAGLIRLASHAVYGAADSEIYAVVRIPADSTFADATVKRVKPLEDDLWLVTLPHYQGFTDTAPLLAGHGIDFIEIAGNDEILMSFIAPIDEVVALHGCTLLFRQPLLAEPCAERVVVQVPVRSLSAILCEMRNRHLRLEHLFDY